MLSGYSVYVGDIAGLEEMYNNCGEVTYTGTLNRGFAILSVLPDSATTIIWECDWLCESSKLVANIRFSEVPTES